MIRDTLLFFLAGGVDKRRGWNVFFSFFFCFKESTRTHSLCLLGLGALLGEEHGVDVGEDTTRGNGDATHQLVELLVVANGELDVAGHNAGLLVVTGCIASELKDLGGEVLKDGCHVHGGTSTHAGGDLGLLHVAGHTTHGELKPGLGATGNRLG